MDLIVNLATAKCAGHGATCAADRFPSQVGLHAAVDDVREYRLQ